jgi:hypothetical protein
MILTLNIEHYIDERGRPCVKVPLARSDLFCILEEQDFNTLAELGISLHWKFKQGCIWVRDGNKTIALGRILLDAKQGQCLRYANHNPLDLRRGNLVLCNGMAKYDARSLLTKTFPRIRYELQHEHAA